MSVASGADAAPGRDAGFAPSADGTRWVAVGALTFDTAAPAFAAAQALPLPSAGVVECAGIEAVDSAAVALLLAVRRRAADAGAALAFVGVPAPLVTLARLYGVEAFLET